MLSKFNLKEWILSHPQRYNFFQKIISKHGGTVRYFTENYILPKKPNSVLEIGCGTGTCLQFLPDQIKYIGVDISSEYIDFAKNKYGHRGTFILGNLSNLDPGIIEDVDLVLAIGFFHHVNNKTVNEYLTFLKENLSKNCQLLSIDPYYICNRFSIGNYIVSKDRGQFIRTKKEYIDLVSSIFRTVTANTGNDLLRVPYHHCILSCSDFKF